MWKVRRQALIFFAIASFTGAISNAAQQQNIRSAIEAGNQKFIQAFQKGDSAAVAALYAANAQVLPPNGEIASGDEPIQKFWQGVMDSGIKAAQLETLEVEAFDDTAYEVGKYTLTGEGGKIMDRGKYIVIWKRVNGEWKLYRDIWNSSMSAPAS